MKRDKIRDLHLKTVGELKKLVKKTDEDLARLRIDKGAGKLKDAQQVGKTRHDLARIKTILKAKELNEAI